MYDDKRLIFINVVKIKNIVVNYKLVGSSNLWC